MTTTLSKSYKDIADEFVNEPSLFPSDITDIEQGSKGYVFGIKEFAKYLDGFRTITPEMEALAIQKSREIDREVLFALAKELPKEKVEGIIRDVYSHHRHNKNAKENIGESSPPKGETES